MKKLSLLFIATTLFCQISNYQKNIYYQNLNYDLTYSYKFIIDKSKIVDNTIISYLIVKNSRDSIVYNIKNKIEMPGQSTQNIFEIKDNIPLFLNDEEYQIEHQLRYDGKVDILNKENITFSKSNSSELYLFSGKSNQKKPNFINLNGIYFKPNFTNEFIIGKSNAMFWYIELYNIPSKSDTVHFDYAIYDEKGDVVKTFKKTIIKKGNSFITTGFYNVMAKLGNGEYRLNITLKTIGSFKLNKNAYFKVIKNIKNNTNYDFVKYEVDHYYVLYKLESDEKKFYLKLGKDKQISYIADYFKRLAKVQNVTVQKIRAHIDELANFIQINYGNQSFHPYKLDVAYLLFKYGAPSSRELVTSDPELKDYEIWHYDRLKNGVKFYLSNYNGLGIEIIHCDRPEYGYTDRNWKQKLKKI